MLGIFRKKKLHKKVLILVGVPCGHETFTQIYEAGTSDFVSGLARQFGTSDVASLWNAYRPTADSVRDTLDYATSRGADVMPLDSPDALGQISHYDIVVVISHHSDHSDEFDFMGTMVRENTFLDSLPDHFEGTIDMTSCFSASIQLRMKMHMPYSHVVAVDARSSLSFRMFMLKKVIEILCNHEEFTYIDAISYYIELRDSVAHPETESISSDDIVYLGEETLSSVYAPKSARKEDGIIVQVVIHDEEESDNVRIKALMIDEETSQQNETYLSLKVKKGDTVDVQLISQKRDPAFCISEDHQTMTYTGHPLFFSFYVDISDDCSSSRFVGKLKIHVNSQPVGDMMFTTRIEKENAIDSSCATFDVKPFSANDTKMAAMQSVMERIHDSLDKLNRQLLSCQDNDRRAILKKEISINEKCIELIDRGHTPNTIKKVFISSTSDMKKYRETIKSLVQKCEMYPEMYENWGQGNIYPRDMCCEKVLHSDLFVLILGSKYGYVEPEWNMSMTEIEYHTALQTGMPILIFLQNSFKEDFSRIADKEACQAQERFIEDVKTSRLIRLFEDEDELELRATKELLLNK